VRVRVGEYGQRIWKDRQQIPFRNQNDSIKTPKLHREREILRLISKSIIGWQVQRWEKKLGNTVCNRLLVPNFSPSPLNLGICFALSEIHNHPMFPIPEEE
jgi:hypothetical protein